MFKSDPRLFLSASNNVNSAKALINECKRSIINFNLDGNNVCTSFKNNINNCNINALVNKIEDTKESLMRLDESFAEEYLSLLTEYLQSSTIDTSNMTDEEKMQYNIQMEAYSRDYNLTLLYMLEQAEESGMLTDEMKAQLAYQRELASQYDLYDQMAVLDPTTDEYINLFKQSAESDRKLINLNPNLTEEEKVQYLEKYETDYNDRLTALNQARDARVQWEKDQKELEELMALKDDNNGLCHPFVEDELNEAILDKKISMGIATEDEIAYKNMNGWDRYWTDTGTFVASTYAGLFNITESMADGAVMLGSVFTPDKEWATEFITRDYSGEMYQGLQLSTNMNSYSAYGDWHTNGLVFGETAGEIGMTFAAPWANAAMKGFGSMGETAETALNEGDSYWLAFGKSTVSGVAGAAEGYAMSNMNTQFMNAANNGTFKVLGNKAISGTKNAVSTLAQPGGWKTAATSFVNVTKTGAKKVPFVLKTAGISTLKDVDTWCDTGCVFVSDILEGASTGEWDIDKILLDTGSTFAFNYLLNSAGVAAFGVNVPNSSKNGEIIPTFDLSTSHMVRGNTVEENLLEVIRRQDAKYGAGYGQYSLYEFFNPNSQNYLNYNLITSSDSARSILKQYNPEQIYHALDNLGYVSNSVNPSSFFLKHGNVKTLNYGANQGGIADLCTYEYKGKTYSYREAMNMYNTAISQGRSLPHFTKVGTPEYGVLKKKLMDQGFSSSDASVLLSTIDDAGACSYAATCNEIFYAFKGREAEFFQKFGFPMYKVSNGNVVLNSNELLMDMYVYCNKASNGGGFILANNTLNPYLLKTDRFDVLGRNMLNAEVQVPLSTSFGKNDKMVSKYLNSKGVNYSSSALVYNYGKNTIDDYSFNQIINDVSQRMNKGESLSLDIYSLDNEIHMYSTNPNLYPDVSTLSWSEGGGHAIFITGIASDGFYISSWGQEYKIPFSDLKNGGMFNIYSAEIY